MSSRKFKGYQTFPNFLRRFNTRYPVPFYLWQIKPILKPSKAQKYIDQDCLKIILLIALYTFNIDNQR